MWNNKRYNRGTAEEQLRNTDNKYNKDNKYIYNNLFNIYKSKIEKEPEKKIFIISSLKESTDYNLMSIEDQDRLFLNLMSPNIRRSW